MLEIPEFLDDELAIVIKSEQVQETDSDLTSLPPEVEEQLIVKDLLYCLVGARGSYIKPDDSGHYQISCKMHGSNKSFLESVLPICDDYSLIRSYSEGHFAFSNGRIIHAFCAALRTVTSEYVQMIAKMESYRRLTLALLVSNLQVPAQLLRVLALLVAEIGSKKGCPALSVIHNYLSDFKGSQQIRKLLLFIFQSSAAPLLSFVEKWIYNGLIDDPFEEFFIQINETISPDSLGAEYEEQFWQRRFEIVKDRLPKGSFISKNAIDKILFAGKSIAVLTICGLKMPKTAKLTLQALQRETVLDSAKLNSSLRLVTALRDRYELMKFMKMFHDVYLIGRGDWFHKFVKQAGQLMKQPKDHIHLPALDTDIGLSLPSGMQGVFFAAFDEELLIDRVKRIHSVSAAHPSGRKSRQPHPFATSWDYFDVTARVEWPLSLVFTDTIQKRYQLLFRTLITWKRLEKKLGHCWKLATGIHQFDRIRFAMQLFVTGYLNFTSTLVVHPQWAKTTDTLQTTASIESVFQCHEDALDAAMKGFFLTDPKCFELLTAIANAISQFIDELKKWRVTVSGGGISMAAKLRHGKPMIKFFNVFEEKVQHLIQQLIAMANREANRLYTDFVQWININDAYFHSVALQTV